MTFRLIIRLTVALCAGVLTGLILVAAIRALLAAI